MTFRSDADGSTGPRRGPGRLARRQVRIAVAIALAAGLVLSAVQIVVDYTSARESIDRQLTQVLGSTTMAAREAVWTLSEDLANGVTEGLLSHPLIVGARIATRTGTVLSDRRRDPAGAASASEAGYLFGAPETLSVSLSHPDDPAGDVIGRLALRVDPIRARQEFLDRVTVIMLSGAAKSLVVALALLVVFHFTLTRPIERYAAWIRRIDPQDPAGWDAAPPPRQRRDELGALGETTAGLLRQARGHFLELQRTRAELLRVNEQLEWRVEQRTRELRRALADSERLAVTDDLTELPNRRSFMQTAEQRHAHWREHDAPYALLLLDLDHFKLVNDRHGHPAGDRVLRTVGTVLAGSVRQGDTVARIGGEEFGILLGQVSPRTARRMAERLLAALADTPMPLDGEEVHLTASCGVAWCSQGDTLEALFRVADQALYRAKAAGRNQVHVAQDARSTG